MQSMGQQKVVLNHTKRLGNVQFLSYLKSQPETVHTIFSIQKYLEGHPPFYLNSILTFLKGKELIQIKQFINKEYELLIKGSSFLQKMNASIDARRKCINKIRRDVTKATKVLNLFQKEYSENTAQDAAYSQWVELQGYSAVDVDESIENSIKLLSTIFMDMSRLRQMTIYIVETIHAWRIQLQQYADRCQQHQPIHFLHQNSDIYQTILQDTSFIWVSKLSAYIWMQAKQDPFFIRNVIHIEQRQQKTPLQKYFLETLYPKQQIIVDKCLKCFEMLVFKYKPKITNLFEEEQLLIQNYLRLEMQNNQFDQQKKKQQAEKQQAEKGKEQVKEVNKSPQRKNKVSIRGWVFQKNLKGRNREKINQIIESHKQKMNIIRPFNIANYSQKNSIALAYLSQPKKEQRENRRNQFIMSSRLERENNFFSEGEEYQRERLKKEKKQIESEPQIRKTNDRMFKSLTKINPVIFQDPKQHLPDTPKRKAQQKRNKIVPSIEKKANQVPVRHPSLNQIRLNSFDPLKEEEEEKIQVDQEQTPLNMKQFFEVFRADTNKPRKEQSADPKKGIEKIKSIKQFLSESRKQRAKSLNFKKTVLKKKKNQMQKSKQKNQSHDSYKEFSKVNAQGVQVKSKESNKKIASKTFINLKAKSIPFDLIIPYVKYISSQQHTTSHSFTQFKTSQVLKKLSDPFIHCIIFDVLTENHEHLGHVVLSESISGRAGKLKYTVEFMNIHIFQFVISTVLRISEELLSTTPCQEVIFPFVVDKLDIVSSHFIELIDAGLSEGVNKFGTLSILQKPRPSYKGTDVKQRLYIFTSQINIKRQYELALKMMGNYRSLKFQTRCLVMSSNFILRTKNLFKDTIHKYKNISIGELYVNILSKIMTKYHLKQLKAASFSLDTSDQLTQLLHKDFFVRNIISNLMNYLGEDQRDQLIMLTVFSSMTDLINYLRYKKHDLHFQFHFLEESRFILNHELVLTELQQQVSMDFALTSNKQIYVMHNHKNLPIRMLTSKNMGSSVYLVPTSNDKIKLLFMSGLQYVNDTTDEMDLYSYINYFFKDIHTDISLNDVPAVVLPNLKNNNSRVTPIKMYDGFLNLFPQREFYSAAMVTCINHWDSYYPNAVIHLPRQGSIVLQYPFLLGFYDQRNKYPLSVFLYKSQSQSSL